MLKLVIISVLTLAGGQSQDVQEPGSKVPRDQVGQAIQPQVVKMHGDRQLFAVPPLVVPGLPVTQKAEQSGPERRHTDVFGSKHANVTTGPCNMPVIVGDASVDPGILIQRQHSHSREHKIRIAEPKACGQKLP